MKIALLICDTPAPHLKEEFGDYNAQFTRLFQKSCESCKVTSFDVVSDSISKVDPNQYDLIAITGAKASAYDEIEWIVNLKHWIKSAIANTKVRFFAVCFGHQVVAEAMGGKVEKNSRGWEVGWQQIDLNTLGKSLFPGKSGLRINQMHQDVVTVAPTGFSIFASTDVCENHGMCYEDRVVTIQGHPEFVPEFIRELLK